MPASSLKSTNNNNKNNHHNNNPLLTSLADPPPSGIPTETIETYLKAVDIQLDLAKSLVDTYSAGFDEALKVHRLLHDNIQQLCKLGDCCLATWADFNTDEKKWLENCEEDEQSSEHLASNTNNRWNRDEIILLEKALEDLKGNKRRTAEIIHQTVKTKSVQQIRERLRRRRKAEKLREANNSENGKNTKRNSSSSSM